MASRASVRARSGALPVLFALLLNVVVGPLSPLVPGSTVSAANEGVNIDQCANGAPTGARTACSWQNGNLNGSNSQYREDNSVAFRANVTGLTTATTYTLVIQYDSTDSNGRHAYDFLTSWNRTESGDPCAGLACGLAGTAGPIPLDANLPPGVQEPGVINVWGANITSVTFVSPQEGHTGANRKNTIAITFTTTSTSAVFAWGGHIASEIDWGAGNGAASSPGSSYHMRFQSLLSATGQNLTGNSNQDRSLQADAVLLEPAMTTQVSSATIDLGQSVTDLATLTERGNRGHPTGTVSFFVCGPGQANPVTAGVGCASGGTQVGAAKTLSGSSSNQNTTDTSTATSDAFTPSAGGTYCFRAVYTPASNNNQGDKAYIGTSHTNATTECVTVRVASISVEKTPVPDSESANAALNDVQAGDAATFTIVTRNTGLAAANGVKLTDLLPQVEGGWTISSSTWPSGATACAITGIAPAAQTLTCGGATGISIAAGGSVSVSITTTTDGVGAANDCGELANAAANATSSNAGSATDNGEIDVLCANVRVTKTPDEDATEPIDPSLNDVNAGDAATFTILTENIGSGEARGLKLNDTLPAVQNGWTISASTWPAGAAACAITGTAPAAQTLACGGTSGATLAGGGSFSVSVTTTTDGVGAANDCGEKTNAAASATTTNDGSHSDAGEIDVVCGELRVTKTPDEDTTEPINPALNDVTAGDNAVFTILTENIGFGQARGVTLSDVLPQVEGGWAISASTWPTGATACAITGTAPAVQTLSCGGLAGITLASGASVSVSVTAVTDGVGTANDCGQLTNAAATANSTNDGSPSDAGEIDVLCADIRVTKTPDEDSSEPIDASLNDVNAGDAATFTIVTDNIGTGEARGVTLSDALPAVQNGWTISASTWPIGAGCVVTGTAPAAQTLSCGGATGVTLAAAGSLSVSVTTTTDGVGAANDCGQLTNAAATATSTNDGSGSDAGEIDVLCAAIQVTKTPDEDTTDPINPALNDVTAGDNAVFTIVTSNTGLGEARGVTLTDSLPQVEAGWAISASTWPAGATGCIITGIAPAAQTLSCGGLAGISLAAGANVSVSLTAVTDGVGAANDCGQLTNAAATATSTNDGSSTDAGEIDVLCADVRVTKTPDEDTTEPIVASANDITAGAAATFTILTENIGTGEARGVKLVDELPATVGTWSIVAASSTWPTGSENSTACAISTASGVETLTCGGTTGVTLPAGGSFTVAVTSLTTGSGATNDCGSLVNVAASATTTNDGSSSDGGEIDVLCPNPSVTKTAAAASVTAGNAVGFTVTVNGGGTGSATNVVLTDSVPTGHTWTVGGADIGSCSAGATTLGAGSTVAGGVEIRCEFGSVGASASKTITVASTSVAADCADGISNTATITAGGDVDTSTQSNSSTASIDVNCPDVSVTKSASSATVQAPGTLTYTIDGANTGQGAAAGVVITDDLDDDLVVTSATFDVDPQTAGGTGTCSVDEDNAVTCTIGTLAAGGSDTSRPDQVRVTIVVTVPTAACGTVANQATIAATNETQGAAVNNQSAAVNVTVVCPDVSVDKNASSPVTLVGASGSFTIIVSGGTKGTTNDVTLTDTVPSGFTWTVGGAAIGDCAVGEADLTAGSTVNGGQTISCNFGPLGPNATRSIGVTTTPTSAACAGTVTNTATVAAGGDTDTSNNTDSAQFSVRCPTLVIEKVASTETVTISGPNEALVATPAVVTWTLTYSVTNGPVTGAVITDAVPTGFTFLDAADGGTFSAGTVTWDLGTVSSNGSVSFRTTVDPIALPRTGQTNVATIDSNETTPDTGQDGVSVVVLPPPLGSQGGPPTTPRPLLPNTAVLSMLAGALLELLAALVVTTAIGLSVTRGRLSRGRRR